MTFKHKFNSVTDIYGNGYYAYIEENNDLVICESWPHEGGETFRGKCFDDVSDRYKSKLEKEAPTLFNELSTFRYQVDDYNKFNDKDIELIEKMFEDIAQAPTGGVDENFQIRPLKDQLSDSFIQILAAHLIAKGWKKD